MRAVVISWLRGRAVERTLRLAALCSWVALVVLSLVPGQDRPHTGMSGNGEHVLAYVLASLVTRLGFRGGASHRQVLAFAAAAALFELCQIWVPGRSAGVGNWIASSAGALIGTAVAGCLLRGAWTGRRPA